MVRWHRGGSIVLVAIAVVLVNCLPAYGQRRRVRDEEGPSENRIKIVNMLTEGRRLAVEGGRLRKEAIEGRVPDRSKPKSEGEKWIDLTDEQRLSRFAEARTKFAAAVTKAAEAQDFLNKHPGTALDEAPSAIQKRWTEQYALTIVADCRFRMSKDIGTVQDWKKLAAMAVKADKDSAEARQLVEDIKKKEEEIKEAAREKREEEARKKKEEAESKKDDDAKSDDESAGKKDD